MDAISEVDVIEFGSGRLTAGVVPDIGGSIAFFRRGETDILRPLSAQAAAQKDVLGVASFPMLPYANRIIGNCFNFEDQTYTVPPNNGIERFNVHGSGWKSVWSVAQRTRDMVELVLDHRGTADPFRYRAVQSLALSSAGLTIDTRIINTGSRPMPFGFGHHPWLERDRDLELQFRATHFWLEAPEGVVSDRIGVPPELSFAGGRGLPKSWRNNCYSGWDGTAQLRFPSRALGLHVQADPIFGHLMFYADPSKPYFCLEPQTNASCAFNKMADGIDGLGVIVLAPGQSASGRVSFTPFEL